MMKTVVWSLAIMSVCVTGCIPSEKGTEGSQSDVKIVDGREVRKEEPIAAFMAALVYVGRPDGETRNIDPTVEQESEVVVVKGEDSEESDDGPVKTPFCSAVLVSKTKLLTAAHCTEVPGFGENTKVVFSHDVQHHEALEYDLAAFRVHKDYVPEAQTDDGAPSHDLALLQLKKPAPGRSVAVPIAAEDAHVRRFVTPLTILGYGKTGKENERKGVLRAATTYMEAEPTGKTEYTTNSFSTVNSCHGDSGGAAFITQDGTPQLLGIASYMFTSKEEGCKTGRAAYTDMREFRAWALEASVTSSHAEGEASENPEG